MRQRHLAVLVASVLALSACASDIDDTPGSDSADSAADQATTAGPWSFTDGSGKTVELDQTPERIIAHAGAAAALMTYGIKPVGIYGDESVDTDPNLDGLDLSGIEILGEEWGTIDVAKASTLSPDLIVADYWPVEEAYSGMEDGTRKSSRKLADLAPVVGAAQGESILAMVEEYEALAASLSADTEDPELSDDKARFEAALEEFQGVVSEHDGELSALAVSPTDDLLYVANPEFAPELLDFQEWGLEVINPDRPDPGFPYWENLSWENADKYQPDVLLLDSRSFDDSLEMGRAQPTWSSIGAAEAEQVVEWPAFWLHTYADYADALEQLSGDLAGVNATVGS
jgi:iron complex transport system substrate-binding protein